MSHSADEHYAVYDERFPRARKEHVCQACGERIAGGQRYARVFVLFQGECDTVVRCLRCQKLHEHLRGLSPGATWPNERLDCGEDYRDEWGKDPPPEIAALAFALPGEVGAMKGGE